MPIPVFDYHQQLSNVVVEPQIRSRFRRVDLGPVPPNHTHDLGGETFLVMEGQIEFTVAGETVVCGPGQGIFVPPRTTHAVRAIGDAPGVMYLSVEPHIEPTHTQYDAHGERLPPTYGVWREAGGALPPTDESTAALLDRYRETAREFARLTAEHARSLESASVDVSASTKAVVDTVWATLRPALQHLETLERTWNELALRAAA
jgi:mannose-6-phosphate isomerase-like protein (cupin superfamily)